jgi:putative methyltransferase (TIGR04325 family)
VSEWEYVPEGWSRRVRGWDTPAIEAIYRRRWAEFVEAVSGTATLGVAHEVPLGQSVATDDPNWHNVVMTFGYVLARAASTPSLSLLDWGGGPGHYGVLALQLLPEVEIDYHSFDLPRLAALGREIGPRGTYHDDAACLDRTYDLVLASDSLQYSEDFSGMFARLAGAADPWFFVAQLPTVDAGASYVVQQKPDAYGYDTEYLGWVVSRPDLAAAADQAGVGLEREFLAPGVIDAPGAPGPGQLRSFLFRRCDA